MILQKVREHTASSRARIGALKNLSVEISYLTKPTDSYLTINSRSFARYFVYSRNVWLVLTIDLILGKCSSGQCQRFWPVKRRSVQSTGMPTSWRFGPLVWKPTFQWRHPLCEWSRFSGKYEMTISIRSIVQQQYLNHRHTKRYWRLGVQYSPPCLSTRWKSGNTTALKSLM